MNADDFKSVKEWFSTHSRHVFQMADPRNRPSEDDVLSDEIDWITLNREVIVVSWST